VTKNKQNTVILPSIFDPVATPHNFFQTGPSHLLIRQLGL